MNRRFGWRDAAASMALAAMGFLPVARALVTRGIVGQYPSDGTRLMYIMREYLMGSLHDGRVPVWNPFMQFGAPFMADIQWAAFYPLNLLVVKSPPDVAFNVFIGLHLALAGVFTYVLARHWDLSRPAALVAGMAFMLSGRMVTTAWGGTVNVVSAVAWLPLVLLLFDRTLRSPRPLPWGVLTAMAIAVEVLSGHPQHTFYTLFAVAVLAVCRGLESSAGGGRMARAGTPIVAAGAILAMSGGLAAIQLAPTYEAMRLSTRVFEWKILWPPPSSLEGSYNPLRLVTWVAPDIFGNAVSLRPAATDWLSLVLHELHSHEFAAYIGVFPLLLALFSLTAWRTQSRIRFLWVLAGVAMLFALGDRTPLYGLTYALVPPFRPFRVPARFLILVVFSLAVLSGFGVDALVSGASARARAWSKAVLGVAIVFAGGVLAASVLRGPLLDYGHRLGDPLFASRPSGQALGAESRAQLMTAAFNLSVYSVTIAAVLLGLSSEVFRQAARAKRRSHVVAASIVALAGLDLVVHAGSYITADSMRVLFEQSAPIMHVIRAAGPAEYEFTLTGPTSPDPVRPNENVFIHERLRTASGYESFELATYRPLRDRLAENLRHGSSYLADVFSIRFIASAEPIPGGRFNQIASTGTAFLYENARAVPRAYVAGRARAIESGTAMEMLSRESVRPGEEVLIETAGAVPSRPAGAAGRAVIVRDDAEEIRLDVTAERDAYLVLNDTYYPGWSAAVDDRPAPLLRANGHVRAVPVPSGFHRVAMRFHSGALDRGKTVTVATVAGAVVLLALGLVLGRGR